MDHSLIEIKNLDTKAYKQGYSAGLNGDPLSEDKCDPESLPSYRRGYEYGKMEREITVKE